MKSRAQRAVFESLTDLRRTPHRPKPARTGGSGVAGSDQHQPPPDNRGCCGGGRGQRLGHGGRYRNEARLCHYAFWEIAFWHTETAFSKTCGLSQNSYKTKRCTPNARSMCDLFQKGAKTSAFKPRQSRAKRGAVHSIQRRTCRKAPWSIWKASLTSIRINDKYAFHS